MPEDNYEMLILDSSLSELNPAVDAAAARKARLYRSTFIDGDRAIHADAMLIKTYGPEATIRILLNERSPARTWHFGLLRGGLIGPGSRQLAREALRELPDVIREHYQLMTRQHDLQQARRTTLERQERQAWEKRLEDARENTIERGRPAGRTRK